MVWTSISDNGPRQFYFQKFPVFSLEMRELTPCTCIWVCLIELLVIWQRTEPFVDGPQTRSCSPAQTTHGGRGVGYFTVTYRISQHSTGPHELPNGRTCAKDQGFKIGEKPSTFQWWTWWIAMGLVHITSWYPNFNGSHFGLPPSEIHRMTGLPPKIVWTMTYSHRPHWLPAAVWCGWPWMSLAVSYAGMLFGTHHVITATRWEEEFTGWCMTSSRGIAMARCTQAEEMRDCQLTEAEAIYDQWNCRPSFSTMFQNCWRIRRKCRARKSTAWMVEVVQLETKNSPDVMVTICWADTCSWEGAQWKQDLYEINQTIPWYYSRVFVF